MTKLTRYLLVFAAFAMWPLGLLIGSYNTILTAVVFLWINNMIYGFEKPRSRIIFLVFNFTYAVFLISRPLISMLKGTEWWYSDWVHLSFSLVLLSVGLIFMQIGAVIGEKITEKSERAAPKRARTLNEIRYREAYVRNLRIAAGVLFYFSFLFYMLMEGEKLLYVMSHSYLEYYSSFKSAMPYVVYVVSRFMPYTLCIFLATYPKKLHAFLPLVLYVFSAGPSLLMGLRNPIVLNLIFCIVYYYMRDIYENGTKWFGRFERAVTALAAPAGIIMLGIFNYTRSGSESGLTSGFEVITDFFYKQGVSFDVLAIAHSVMDRLPVRPLRNYTFGGFLDYFLHGNLAQTLFGAADLGDGNNVVMGTVSNSFSHNMSYLARGQDYLNGNGYGSSFLLETYVDFGFVGVALFSIVLGIFMIYMIKLAKKGTFGFAFVLICLTSLFFAPRDAATGWLQFIVTAQFWLPTAFCWFFAALFNKSYSIGFDNTERRKIYV